MLICTKTVTESDKRIVNTNLEYKTHATKKKTNNPTTQNVRRFHNTYFSKKKEVRNNQRFMMIFYDII